MSTLAILLARGGSKRIPRKNIRPFHGVPIIAYFELSTITVMQLSDSFNTSQPTI